MTTYIIFSYLTFNVAMIIYFTSDINKYINLFIAILNSLKYSLFSTNHCKLVHRRNQTDIVQTSRCVSLSSFTTTNCELDQY